MDCGYSIAAKNNVPYDIHIDVNNDDDTGDWVNIQEDWYWGTGQGMINQRLIREPMEISDIKVLVQKIMMLR